MQRSSFARAVCTVTALLLAACAERGPAGPAIVAEIEGKPLTVGDVQAYLDANLPARDGESSEATPAVMSGEEDEVRSRLFDNFIDEEVLVFEAQRQGVTVDEDEIDAWLRVGADDAVGSRENAARRAIAKRSLIVDKLRGKLIRARVSVTPDEVDAWVSQHKQAEATDRRLALRSYKLPSESEARRLRPRIARTKPSAGPGPGEGEVAEGLESEPLEVDLSSLPPEVRAAVGELPAGGVSEPVTVQGSIYLFRVDAWLDPARDGEDRLRERAQRELLRVRHEEASRLLIRELKQGIRLRIDVAKLPFRYVPEGGS